MSQSAPTTSLDDLTFPTDENNSEEILAILNSDPFAAPQEPAPSPIPADPQPGPASQPAPAPAPGAPAPTPAPNPAPAPAPAVDPTMAALLAQGQTLEQIAARLQQQPAAQPAPVQVDPRVEMMRAYTLNVPPELIASLQSEDPVQVTQAIQTLMAAPAMAVHQRFETILTERLQALEQRLTQGFSQQMSVRQQTQDMRSDFYGRYKGLDNDQLRPLVVQAAQALMATPEWKGAKGYTPGFGDAIAAYIKTKIPALAALVDSTPTPAQPQTRQNPQPTIINPGARPAQPGPQQPDILDQLGLSPQ